MLTEQQEVTDTNGDIDDNTNLEKDKELDLATKAAATEPKELETVESVIFFHGSMTNFSEIACCKTTHETLHQ